MRACVGVCVCACACVCVRVCMCVLLCYLYQNTTMFSIIHILFYQNFVSGHLYFFRKKEQSQEET